MAFRTKLDFSSNRQVKQNIETVTVLSGGTSFGVTFNDLPSGPNLNTSGITNTVLTISSTFSGNNTTTNYVWGDSRMTLGASTLSALTPSNSGTTQEVLPTFTTNTSTVIDGNIVSLTYTGVTYDVTVSAMTDLGGGNYSGTVNTLFLDILSASTLDFTGRTIWNDVSGITRTERLIITNSPQIGYVLGCIDSEGMSGWVPSTSGGSYNDYWSSGTGVNAIIVKNSGSVSTGTKSLAEGNNTIASGDYSHAEGNYTTASGNSSHSEGYQTIANGSYSHAEGYATTASGIRTHAEGSFTIAGGAYSHAEGGDSIAVGAYSHAEGWNSAASGQSSHSEGHRTIASGESSHAEGDYTTASGYYTHAEGKYTIASGESSHAEGSGTTASGYYTHAEGHNTLATDYYSHAEGNSTIASGITSHAEGGYTVASGSQSHAEGFASIASGQTSHAQGYFTIAIGANSHASGDHSIASGYTSFVHGYNSQVNGDYSIVLGSNITGNTDNTTYVDQLNIKTVGSGAFTNNINIDANGNLTTATSDERLKENILPLSGSLLTINALQGVSYQWKDRNAGTDTIKLGFIAQQVNGVDPRLTFTNKVDGYMGIHTDSIIPLLVEAVKELSIGVTSSNNTHLETQTILAEDNNIDLNYNGSFETAIGGGITVLHAMGTDLSAKIITDENGNWVTNNDFKPKGLTIPVYTPISSADINGNIGNLTRDEDYLYLKTNTGWKRTNLESF